MDSLRKTALVAGVFYVITFVSIPTLALYGAVHDPNYMVGPGPDTPVVLYPVVKRQGEARALGFVGARVLEAATIFVGVASLLTVVTLRQAGAGADGLVAGQALVAFYDRIFALGQGLIPAVNALLLGTLLYQSRLVPRALPMLGLIGAALLIATDAAVVFGLLDRLSPLAAILTIPIAVWEFSLGVYLIVKGFKPSPITADMTAINNQSTH